MAKRSRTRSAAARKGWKTRRAGARKRSAAARKGWKTRRAGARKRSAAARKGWKTRRARQKGTQEYQINVKYKAGTKSKVEVQISATGPTGSTREQVIAAVETRRRTGRNPKGWSIKVTEWKKGKYKYSGDNKEETWRAIGWLLPEAEIVG